MRLSQLSGQDKESEVVLQIARIHTNRALKIQLNTLKGNQNKQEASEVFEALCNVLPMANIIIRWHIIHASD